MVSGLTIGLLVVEDRRRVAEGALIAANAANQEKGLALEAAAQAGREKDDALAGERTARVAERQGDYGTRVAFALRAWSGNEVPQADALLDGCPTECRNWEWGYLKRLCRSGLTTLDPGGDGGEILYSVAVSPDGRLIAAGAFRGTVSVWEAATGRKVATLAAYASVLAFSPDGRLLVTGRAVLMPAREARATGPIGDTLQVWDVDTGKVIHSWAPDPRGVTRVTFSPDGKWLAATGYDGAVRVWDAATGGPQAVLPGTTAEASRVAFSPDGGLLAAGYNDGKVRVWAAGTWVARYVLTGRPVIVGLGFAATGRIIAGTSAGDIYVWDMADGHALGTFHGRAVWAGDLAVRADGVEVAVTDRDGSVRIIDGRTGLELRAYHVPSGAARAIAYTPDGRRLAVATGVPGPLAVWDVTQAQEVRTRMLPNSSGADLCYSPDGRFLAFNASSTIALWDAESLTPLRVLSGVPTHAHLCFRADGSRLAAANGSALAVWDTDTGERLTSAGGLAVPDPPAGDQPAVLKIPRPEVLTIASSPDGRQVAVAGRAGMVSVWAADGTGLVQICSLGGTTRSAIAQYSPDGRFLVAISEYGVAFVWDAADGRLVRTLGDAHSENRGLAFSRDGRYFAAGNGTKSISVWETATGREVRRLPRSGRLYALAFSPDGRRLAAATAGRDPAQAELWLWDPESGQEILNLHVPIRVVIGLWFHPNGKQLVAHAADRVLVWDATPLPGP
jgi:WD40 repeat protein